MKDTIYPRYTLILVFTFNCLVFAEDQIESYQILDKIKNGIDIKYKNIIVVGDLDFTELYDKKSILTGHIRDSYMLSNYNNLDFFAGRVNRNFGIVN